MSVLDVALPRWGHRKVRPVLQAEQAECGLACMAMVASYHGHEIDLPTLRRRFGTSVHGISLSKLCQVAHGLRFDARPLKVDIEALSALQLPSILHWDMNHFVVLESIERSKATVIDPAYGTRTISIEELGKHFTGVVLELSPRPEFQRVKEVRKISLMRLAGQVRGLKRAAGLLLGLAAVIEFFSLLAPMQMQWVVDNVIQPNDSDLLWVIAAAFIVLAGIQCGLAIARGHVMTWLAATVNAQWIRNLFSHLLRLPLEFFQKRSGADICSRFDSVRAIQTTLTGAFAQSALDGAMSLGALALLAVYSPSLAGVALLAAGAYGGARWMAFAALRRANEEELVYGARQIGVLIESIKGIQAIKIADKMADRAARMTNTAIALAEREMRRQRAATTFAAVNQCIFGIERILLVSLGAMLCLRSQATVGMLLAVLFYADAYNTRIAGLIDKWVEFRLLNTHAARIADIALEPPEESGTYGAAPMSATQICVRGLGFRYSEDSPWVFRHLTFTVDPGQSVAIVGPSGSGKSTLAKLLLGLMVPTEGVIEVGGVDIARWGKENYRSIIAAVMQDDTLFDGTLFENISFSDPLAQPERIEAAARAASIHKDIMAMPMRYESRVGEGGAALSGGQRQRVFFARALYRDPKILVLDEATSHLDVALESEINTAVKAVRCTRIVIAHRPQTIASADQVIRIDGADAVAYQMAG